MIKRIFSMIVPLICCLPVYAVDANAVSSAINNLTSSQAQMIMNQVSAKAGGTPPKANASTAIPLPVDKSRQDLSQTEIGAKEETPSEKVNMSYGTNKVDSSKSGLSRIERMYNALLRQTNEKSKIDTDFQMRFLYQPKVILSDRQPKSDNVLETKDAKDNLSPAEKFQAPPNVLENAEDMLYQFGYEAFSRSMDSTFTDSDVPVGRDYILGPGDSIVIYIWGKIEEKFELTLDNQGKVAFPKAGYIYLAQTSVANAEKIIKKELSKFYVNFEVKLTVGALRSFRVYVLGDVQKPGAYNVSSLATFYYALFQAGGPTKSGSMRKIKLLRNRRTIQQIDLYQYLVFGDRNQDPKLQANDTIFVPSIGKTVCVEGMIKHPGIYELKGQESVQQVLDLTGGMSGLAYQQKVQVERVGKKDFRLVKDLMFKNNADKIRVLNTEKAQDGDIVRILPISSNLTNFVLVNGSVNRPGRYSWRKGLTMNALVNQAGGLANDAHLKRIDVFRQTQGSDQRILAVNLLSNEGMRFQLRENDIVKIYSASEVVQPRYAQIEGAVEHSGRYRIMENMRVSDLIFAAQLDSRAKTDQTELVRRVPGKDPQVLNINIQHIIKEPQSAGNFLLEDGDYLFIKQDARYAKQRLITLSGEVKYPGTYVALDGELLSAIVERAGGFTDKAFLDGAVFKRESVRAIQQSGQQRAIQEERKRLLYEQAKLSNMSTDIYSRIMQSREEALQFLDQATKDNLGRVIIALKPLDEFKGGTDDLEVENGDSLLIPSYLPTVQVMGGVKQTQAIVYQPGADFNYYLAKAGGYTGYADSSNVYVFKANGTVSSDLKTIGRGDTIYVPEIISVPIDWVQVLTNVTNALVNLATLRLVLIK